MAFNNSFSNQLAYRQNSSVFVPQLAAQIPWGHNRLIIAKIKNIDEALFYVRATLHISLAFTNTNPITGGFNK
jgi:hypothetical protein